jgi:toxin ParE1/3/4
MNVHWTEAALADLRGIEAYIARHSERYARAMVERIFRHTEALAQFPQIGGVVPEYEDESLRELFEHPYPHCLPGVGGAG